MISRILVALDGSPFAEWALPSAIAMARSTGADLRLVSVVEEPPVLVSSEQDDSGRVKAEAYLGDVVERICLLCPGRLSTSVREGRVAEELEAEAVEWGADVIAMSTHGRAGLSRLLMGSIAAHCVEAGWCPVLLVRPPGEGEVDLSRSPWVGRVVVPLDGSELAEEAIEPAVALTRAFGVHALLLRVLPERTPRKLTLLPDSAERTDPAHEEERAEARSYLKHQVARVRRSGTHAYGMLLSEPDPAESIASRVAGDFVVMATHGHGRLDRALLGSVTDKVVREAGCPVMVIRPTGRAVSVTAKRASAGRP